MRRVCILCITGWLVLGLFLSGCAQKVAPIRVATWPPFEYVTRQTNKIEDLDTDLFSAITAKRGLQVDYIKVDFDPFLAGLALCQYDVAISSITINDEHIKDMNYSDPHFPVGQVITVRKGRTEITSKKSLVGKKIEAQIATTGADEAKKSREQM